MSTASINSPGNDSKRDIKSIVPTAFGIISCIMFVCGLLVVFFWDSLAEEYEYYPRRK